MGSKRSQQLFAFISVSLFCTYLVLSDHSRIKVVVFDKLLNLLLSVSCTVYSRTVIKLLPITTHSLKIRIVSIVYVKLLLAQVCVKVLLYLSNMYLVTNLLAKMSSKVNKIALKNTIFLKQFYFCWQKSHAI